MVQALNPPNYSMVSMLTILEKFPLQFITRIKTRKNIVLKKRSWGGMVFLKMKIGCWVETEGFILCYVYMYAALHFPKMHITQLFFNRVFWERT